jgi:hypothetical protein
MIPHSPSVYASVKTCLIFILICYCCKECAASHQKSLSGLDNIATEGSSAFQTLHDVAAQLSKAGKNTTQFRASVCHSLRHIVTV